MSLLTVGASKATTEVLKGPLTNKFSLVNETNKGSHTFLTFKINHESTTDGDSLVKFSSALTYLIFDQLQKRWLQRLLVGGYSYFDKKEQQEILELAYEDLINTGNLFYPKMWQSLESYLQENNQIYIDGFIRFRMKDYWSFLCETLDTAVDRYLIDKEYQEFIKLLRYFVDLQEPKIAMVNVIFEQDDGFSLLDQHGAVIGIDYLEGIILEIGQNEFDFEDLLISALITVAPARIVLHGQESAQVTQTIISIFANKVTLCSDCNLCGQNLVKKH